LAKKLEKNQKTTVKSLLKDILFVVVFFLVFTTFGWSSFHIPSGSMEPTLEVGDRLFVSKYAYGYNRYSVLFEPKFIFTDRALSSIPKRGDVAVFVPANIGNEAFIKRVIGLPGDTVQMISGRLYINNKMVERAFVRDVNYTNYNGRSISVKEYDETLPNGVVHRIYEQSDRARMDNTNRFKVPAGHYFMMGDNRDGSQDSRARGPGTIGYVKHEYLVGRAGITTFSLYDCDQGKDITCPLGIPFGRFFDYID